MKISYDLDLESFDAWSGAVPTLEKIKEEGKCRDLEAILEELYPDGMDETSLNDLLLFDSDLVFKWLDIKTDEEIEQEEEELRRRGDRLEQASSANSFGEF